MAANKAARGAAKPVRHGLRALLCGGGLAGVALLLGVVLLVPGSGPEGSTPSEQGAQFDAEGSAALVAELAKARAAQGVCYGYELSFNGGRKQVGSNLGVDKPVTGDPTACPKWVRLSVTAVWTSDSSESEDSGSYTLTGSPGLTLPTRQELEDAGLTTAAVIDAPAEATAAAMIGMPLLMAQHGLPVVPATGGPVDTASPEPLTTAGSDFLRENSGQLVAAATLLAGALGVFGYGLFGQLLPARRRRRTEDRLAAEQMASAMARRAANTRQGPPGTPPATGPGTPPTGPQLPPTGRPDLP
ncbi:hypothetical protein Lfu02_47280 [Longispora fulva]|uniref:Uncharacterized protein n=1 Tax=Longispora fulva TaxID=619741 RepID=A0A8J7GTJ8_9ACTN|nr:hypothetical protein [Longispora fulva]MBG6138103.1 hypothetical protein [Longispora fulva]GIG60356.1 hypothetical protein Lfu02_47280 [Longispora fulva]